MAWKPLPLTGDPYANVEEVELDGVSAHIQDAYVNELGHTVKRPGLEEFVANYGGADPSTLPAVTGLYWDEVNDVVLATGRTGSIWQIQFDGTATQVNSLTTLSGHNRVSFATDRTRLFTANGGAILQTTLSATPTGNDSIQVADAQAPTTVSHLATLDGYLIATAGGRTFQFSDPTDMTSWAATDTATKAGRTDDLIAIYEGWSELMLVGTESVEVWYNDGVTPFVRRVNGMIPTGCSAAHTFRQVGNHWMWLDQKRRFVRLDSRTPTHISFPYHKLVQTFETVADAYSDNMEVSGFRIRRFIGKNMESSGRVMPYAHTLGCGIASNTDAIGFRIGAVNHLAPIKNRVKRIGFSRHWRHP